MPAPDGACISTEDVVTAIDAGIHILRLQDELCVKASHDELPGGVFAVFNAHVDEVRNRGPV